MQPMFHPQHGLSTCLFSVSMKKMLEVVGKKTIHIRTLTNNTKRVTMAVTIAVDGMLLPSTYGGIAQTEFATYPAAHHCCCQDATWMDEQVMLTWVDDVLAPYVATTPKDFISVMPYHGISCPQNSGVGH